MIIIEIGKVIQELRKEQNISARELSRRSGISQGYLSQLETGKNSNPTNDVLKKIAKGLDMSYVDLMNVAGYIDSYINEYTPERAQADGEAAEHSEYRKLKYPDLLEFLKSNPVYYNAKRLNKTTKEIIIQYLDLLTKDLDVNRPTYEETKKEIDFLNKSYENRIDKKKKDGDE